MYHPWNSLPTIITAASTLPSFRRAHKYSFIYRIFSIISELTSTSLTMLGDFVVFLTLRHPNLFFFTLDYIYITSNITHLFTTISSLLLLDKDRAKYDLRKFYFTNRVVNAWNSLQTMLYYLKQLILLNHDLINFGNIRI